MANPAPSPEQGKRDAAVRLRQEHAARGAMRWLPGLVTLRGYEPAWLRHDLMAGLVLTTMLVPVGIAYAVASGLPGVYGLYATIVPLLVYALFGPCRILALGGKRFALLMPLFLVACAAPPTWCSRLDSPSPPPSSFRLDLPRVATALGYDVVEFREGFLERIPVASKSRR